MQTRTFERFLKHLSELTQRQRERLLGLLLPLRQTDRVVELIEGVGSGATPVRAALAASPIATARQTACNAIAAAAAAARSTRCPARRWPDCA